MSGVELFSIAAGATSFIPESIKLIHLLSIILPSNSIFYKVYVCLYSIFGNVKEVERYYAFCSPCSCPFFFLPNLPLKGLLSLFAHFFFALCPALQTLFLG